MDIFIIDDDPSICELLAAALKIKGHSAAYVHSGAEAFTWLESHQPAAILLDLLLPGMTGEEVLKKLRENPALKEIPIFILSGMDDPDERAKLLNLGAQDVLLKPVKVDHLLTKLALPKT